MNVIYVCPLFSALSIFITKIQIQIQIWKSIFLNLETINQGGQLITAATVKSLTKAGAFMQPPRLKH